MKLETIEDFRRVAKALRDPSSSPQHYAVVDAEDYGYCTVCYGITEYRHDGHKFEQTDECQKCHRRFGTGMRDLPSSGYITEISEMPASAVRMLVGLGKFPSREQQTEYFLGQLKEFIEIHDHMTKEAKREVRAFAKKAGDGRRILAAFV